MSLVHLCQITREHDDEAERSVATSPLRSLYKVTPRQQQAGLCQWRGSWTVSSRPLPHSEFDCPQVGLFQASRVLWSLITALNRNILVAFDGFAVLMSFASCQAISLGSTPVANVQLEDRELKLCRASRKRPSYRP